MIFYNTFVVMKKDLLQESHLLAGTGGTGPSCWGSLGEGKFVDSLVRPFRQGEGVCLDATCSSTFLVVKKNLLQESHLLAGSGGTGSS